MINLENNELDKNTILINKSKDLGNLINLISKKQDFVP